MDKTILERMRFTPAEKQVILEQAEGLIASTRVFIDSLGDTEKMSFAFCSMDGHKSFIEELLNAKAAVAVREIVQEQAE